MNNTTQGIAALLGRVERTCTATNRGLSLIAFALAGWVLLLGLVRGGEITVNQFLAASNVITANR